jgi:hypothetical protein
VAWGGAAPAPGPVFAERATGFGLGLDRAIGEARLTDARLLAWPLRYTHYGGRGEGWIEAAVDGRAVPFRLRLDGLHLDLAQVVRETGTQLGHVTGTAWYTVSAELTRAQGLRASVQFGSEGEGGEVSLDAIEGLLASGAVEVETTGLLRQTLANLRSFPYASLYGEVRVGGGQARADVLLEGRRRLGIFPGPVESINVRNVPLAALVRAFGGSR